MKNRGLREFSSKKIKEKGADIRVHIKTPTGKLVLIEVKNWQKQHVKYGVDVAKTEVLKRFEGQDAYAKILIISYKECFNEDAIEFLEDNGITILETGFHLAINQKWTREMFNKFLYHSYTHTDSTYGDKRNVNRTVLKEIFCISMLSNMYNRNSFNYNNYNRLNIYNKNNTNNNFNTYNISTNTTNTIYNIDGLYVYDIDYTDNPVTKQRNLYFDG